jgi:hypothetical protein
VRILLVLHAISAAVLVASATHHLIWSLRRRFTLDRLFAATAAVAYASTFALGLVMYPTYKVRVRIEYFDQPASGLMWVSRLFDIKEMWMLVGVAIAGALVYLSRRAHPQDDARTMPLYLGLSALLFVSVWGAAVMGLVVASYKAVG